VRPNIRSVKMSPTKHSEILRYILIGPLFGVGRRYGGGGEGFPISLEVLSLTLE